MKPYAIVLLALWAHRASCSERARPVTTSAAQNDVEVVTPEGDGGARAATPRVITARHILVMHAESQRAPPGIERTRAQARARAEEALRRARAGEDFAALVREYSDEPGAGDRGGSLGPFRHGMMVRAFEDAAFALQVDQISDVVETDFGYHVIQRTE